MVGIYYAGSQDQVTIEGLKQIKDKEMLLGSGVGYAEDITTPIEVYSLINSFGKEVWLGIEAWGEQFCLWLIDPENGWSTRT